MLRVSAAMFPDVLRDVSWLLAVAGVVNILYGASVVLRQTDMKRLIAFSSISHMGFVVLGLSSAVGVAGQVSPLGLTGASLQMFTHGAITGLLFLLVGYVYERAHTRHIPDLGGLAVNMPVLSASLAVAGLASLGLPATAGFVSEIHVFLGTFPVWGLADRAGRVRRGADRRVHPVDDPTGDVRPAQFEAGRPDGRYASRNGSRRGADHSHNGGRDIPLDHRGRVLGGSGPNS